MKTITYNINPEYYDTITKHTKKIIQTAPSYLDNTINEYHTYITTKDKTRKKEDIILETLMIGVYWTEHITQAINVKKQEKTLLNLVIELRDNHPSLKIIINPIKGYLTEKYLITKDNNHIELSLENYVKLLTWMKITGEYKYQEKILRDWINFFNTKTKPEIKEILENIIKFTKYFQERSQNTLHEYTPNVNNFIKKSKIEHKNKEDIIMCTKNEIEYHLNMTGAEIMNKTFKDNYQKRTKKTILVPSCMKFQNSKNCQAKKGKLGDICTQCTTNCPIAQITKKEETENFKVYIIYHGSTAFKNITKQDKKEMGIIGITCILNLIEGGLQAKSINIPAQCVLLNYVGCKTHWDNQGFTTQINNNELKKRL
ncbi:MAG: DUF116 domain-containing protein [Methanobacteriaceae archaeon]|nr:DUF116 domain-containing protein [Methanobacteriaceae archaeon]